MNAQERELEELAKFNNAIDNILDIEPDFNESKGVNRPQLASGLTPVTIDGSGTITPINSRSSEWYDYFVEDKKDLKWANAKSNDGSLWVWIPRFAYKLNSSSHTADIIFLKGTTDEPADTTSEGKSSEDVTIKRVQDLVTGGTDSETYIVHPAFCNGTDTNYANGEWSSDIAGFWMAKFEAGYAMNEDNPQNSEIKYEDISYNNSNYYGTRSVGTQIKYPVFKGSRPSINYICTGDAFRLCDAMNESGKNPYGFIEAVDTHMTKNSEWGAVAYLSQSGYGIGREPNTNNITAGGANTIYAITGYGANGSSVEASNTVNLTQYTGDNFTNQPNGNWTTPQGQGASTTGNITGVYDMNGGVWEMVSAYINTGTSNYGKESFTDNATPKSSDKYRTNYGNNAITYNTKGDAINETKRLEQ